MDRVQIHFGDFSKVMQQRLSPEIAAQGLRSYYEIALFTGVLYHMIDPIGSIYELSTIADTVLCWTQYWNVDPPHAQQIGAVSNFAEDSSHNRSEKVSWLSWLYQHIRASSASQHIRASSALLPTHPCILSLAP